MHYLTLHRNLVNFCLKESINGNWQFWTLCFFIFFFLNACCLWFYGPGWLSQLTQVLCFLLMVLKMVPLVVLFKLTSAPSSTQNFSPNTIWCVERRKVAFDSRFPTAYSGQLTCARATAQLILTCPPCWDGFENLAVHTGLIRGWAPDSPALAAGQAEVPEIIAF